MGFPSPPAVVQRLRSLAAEVVVPTIRLVCGYSTVGTVRWIGETPLDHSLSSMYPASQGGNRGVNSSYPAAQSFGCGGPPALHFRRGDLPKGRWERRVSDTIERAGALLRARLGEIEKEATRLQEALRSLDGGVPTKALRRRRRTKARRSRSKRAARGQRPKQFLAAVAANPKATVSEIAKEIGVSANQAGSLARRLEAKGEIKRSKRGFSITTSARRSKL